MAFPSSIHQTWRCALVFVSHHNCPLVRFMYETHRFGPIISKKSDHFDACPSSCFHYLFNFMNNSQFVSRILVIPIGNIIGQEIRTQKPWFSNFNGKSLANGFFAIFFSQFVFHNYIHNFFHKFFYYFFVQFFTIFL